MNVKNIVSNNLKEFVLQLQATVKEGYAVVQESVDFQAGYFKCFAQKEETHHEVVMDTLVQQAVETFDKIAETGAAKEVPPTVELVAKKRGKK